MTTVAEYYTSLISDSWRIHQPFSPDIAAAHDQIFAAGAPTDVMARSINAWFIKNQPCIFGRVAARFGLLTYCVLTEQDLLSSDEEIGAKIQSARIAWLRRAFEGKSSGFIILAISPRLAAAVPDEAVRGLSRRLGSLYLQTQVECDHVYLDEIFLEIPGNRRTTLRWSVGANYFSTQGDGRWWHDHRIPGGAAFSMNSVGHMVKSGKLDKALGEFAEQLGIDPEGGDAAPLDSLEKALVLAMRTIDGAADTISGRATHLLPRSMGTPICPVELPVALREKDHCGYAAHYHTDYTVPSEYFRADIERPLELTPHALDFTYLFDKAPDNFDHELMGEGRPIRGEGFRTTRTSRTYESEVPIDEFPLLREALRS